MSIPVVFGADPSGEAPPFTCPACGHDAPYGNATGDVIRCSECTSRIAFGVAMPRVIIEPCDDRRFVRLTFKSWSNDRGEWVDAYSTEVDKDYGRAIWHNAQSICV